MPVHLFPHMPKEFWIKDGIDVFTGSNKNYGVSMSEFKKDGTRKARLTCRGFLQRKGIDFYDSSSPVKVYSTFKFLIAHALKNDRYLSMADFAQAFLHPYLKNIQLSYHNP